MFRYILIVFFLSKLLASPNGDPDFYSHIKNINNPTKKELKILQEKILRYPRPILDKMPTTGFIPREFRFLGPPPYEFGEHKLVLFNSNNFEKENCIIVYSSFNKNYPLGVKRLVDAIGKTDYVGHLYYRIGGWPNISNGDIRLVHVPFAFKPCFLKEIQQLGYKRVLWLDSSLLPAPGFSLNLIFQMIKKIGFFILSNAHKIGPYMNEECANVFGLTLAETHKIHSCSAGIIGLDFSNHFACSLLDAWHKAAYDPFAFFSDRSDQNVLSILIHKMELEHALIPIHLLGRLDDPEGSVLLIDRSYVKKDYYL